jgi:hypothetical protein
MILKRKSILSGKVHELEIDITEKQYLDFQNDKLGLIQNAFPHLSRDEREFIISGIHPDEWNEIFGLLND